MFHFLNKFKICSYLKFVQNLNLFKIKINSNSKFEQISEYKKRKQEKQKKIKKNREEAARGLAQHKHHIGGGK
jgi:hypothetical protein